MVINDYHSPPPTKMSFDFTCIYRFFISCGTFRKCPSFVMTSKHAAVLPHVWVRFTIQHTLFVYRKALEVLGKLFSLLADWS